MQTLPNKSLVRPALFAGFPYILTYLAGCLYHVILLSKAEGQSGHIDTARQQVRANRLPTWLVKSEHEALFVDATNPLSAVVPVPRPRSLLFGKLLSQEVIPGTAEILDRYRCLSIHVDYLHGARTALWVGEPTNGSRPASAADIARLSGGQAGGIPRELRRCATCQEWFGTFLDPKAPRLLVEVDCRCENENRCARCGESLYTLKLNSNHFSESHGTIWHVPGFCVITHRCPLAVESWATRRPPQHRA